MRNQAFLLSFLLLASNMYPIGVCAQEETPPAVSSAVEKGACAPTLQEYKDKLTQKGYDVKSFAEPGDITVIRVESTYKSKDTHGLLGVAWDEKQVLNMKYLLSEADPKLIYVSGEIQRKAPLFGKWETVEKISAIPDDMLWKYGAAVQGKEGK